MSLYFVRHQHSPETCPARNPLMGNQLLAYINPVNARNNGVNILGEAVLDGQHTFVLIVEADSPQTVEGFLEPFKAAGTLEVTAASTCENVVERAGC